MTNKSSEIIKKSVLDKIKDTKPTGKNYILIEKASFIFLIISLILLASVLLGVFIIDWNKTINLIGQEELKRRFFLNYIQNFIRKSLLELAFFSFILTIIVYKLYRITDWPLVKRRVLLFLSIFGVIIIIAFSLFAISLQNSGIGNYMNNLKIRQKTFPGRQKQFEDFRKPKKENKINFK